MVVDKRTYVDFDGVERTEEFRFNLNKAELTELQLSTEGGLDTLIEKITESKNAKELASLFKKIILLSYGEKTDDGKYFRKSKEISEAYSQTNAYADLYMELVTNEEKAVAFINGILPPDLVNKIDN